MQLFLLPTEDISSLLPDVLHHAWPSFHAPCRKGLLARSVLHHSDGCKRSNPTAKPLTYQYDARPPNATKAGDFDSVDASCRVMKICRGRHIPSRYRKPNRALGIDRGEHSPISTFPTGRSIIGDEPGVMPRNDTSAIRRHVPLPGHNPDSHRRRQVRHRTNTMSSSCCRKSWLVSGKTYKLHFKKVTHERHYFDATKVDPASHQLAWTAAYLPLCQLLIYLYWRGF